MNVIPAIDLRGGLCVRLYRGDFARETVWREDGLALAHEYRLAGFDHLHVVDLDGAREGSFGNAETIRAIVDVGVDVGVDAGVDAGETIVQVGGGIRTHAAVERWLAAGVARCVVGSVAVSDPDAVAGWIEEFGPERIVVALDVRCDPNAEPVPATEGWRRSSGLTLWQSLGRFRGSSLRHVLCTDVGRDGTLEGPNLALYDAFRERHPEVLLQASGGIRNREDLAALDALGCSAAITGRALLEGTLHPSEAACPRGA